MDDDAALARFALLEGFFRRREEAGKFYCADCLVLQLRQRGSPAFCLGSILAAADDAFERPGALHLKPSGLKTVSQPRATSRDVQPHVVGRRGDRRIVMWIESGPFFSAGTPGFSLRSTGTHVRTCPDVLADAGSDAVEAS